jgi:hypothetical protein
MGSPKLPALGAAATIAGGGAGLVLPGAVSSIAMPAPSIATSYTIDPGTGPQPGGQLRSVRTLLTLNLQSVSQVDLCSGHTVCFDVCAPFGSNYAFALAESLVVPFPIPPFLPGFELNIGSLFFAATFPVNTLSPAVTGLQGVPGLNQVCLTLPPGLVTTTIPLYLQGVTSDTTGITGVSPLVRINLIP